MLRKYCRLKDVLVEGVLSIDTYRESLIKFINMLDEKSKVDDFKKDVQILKLQSQSLLSTLSIIRNIKIKKLNLLKLNSNHNKVGIDKVINIKVNLNNYVNRRLVDQFICLKFKLKDQGGKAVPNKIIELRINLGNYCNRGRIGKTNKIKMYLKDRLGFNILVNINIYDSSA